MSVAAVDETSSAITAEQNRNMRSEGRLVSRRRTGGSPKELEVASINKWHNGPIDWLSPPSNRRETWFGTMTILELCEYPGVD